MDDTSKKFLFDILDSIEKIEQYIGAPRIFENYDSNSMLQDAVERNIEIIGEAVNDLHTEYPEIKITNYRRIIDARNKISYGYDEIENVQIWGIIINHLPILKEEVQKHLGK